MSNSHTFFQCIAKRYPLGRTPQPILIDWYLWSRVSETDKELVYVAQDLGVTLRTPHAMRPRDWVGRKVLATVVNGEFVVTGKAMGPMVRFTDLV